MGNLRKGLAVMLRWSLLIGLALVVLFAPVPVTATIPVERTFRIEASRFQYSPSVLKVNPGDRVTIDLVVQDVIHGLSIDGYNLAITADPGQTAHLSFIAGRPGSFVKIWRIKNSGTCVWSAGYALAFYSGEQMGGQPSIPLPPVVRPGDTVDLRVDLVAPLNQTSYTGNWVLQDASGNVFGVGELGNQSISVTILVKPTPMPTSG